MYFVVVLLSCLSVSLASICCIPPQWEGQLGFVTGVVHNGQVQFSSGGALMGYDAVRQVMGLIETVDIGNKGAPVRTDVLLDYKGGMKYMRRDGKCIKLRMDMPWSDGCIPDNANATALDSVMGLGGNAIKINAYEMDFAFDKNSMSIDFGVTAAGCVPVIETVRGMIDGEIFMENMGYVNITAGLSDPASLNSPPLGCENAPLVSAHYTDGSFSGGVIGRRRSVFLPF